MQMFKRRKETELLLRELKLDESAVFQGKVLIDAMYDNPNFWVRLSLLRGALRLDQSQEVGILGPHAERSCRKSLSGLGILNTLRVKDHFGSRRIARAKAKLMLKETRTPDDILTWKLPFDFPASLVYDGILKLQRKSVVDINAPITEHFVTESLMWLHAAEQLVTPDVELLILSHAVDYTFAPLAWVAAKRGVPTIVLTGYFGVPLFWKINEPDDLFDTYSRPKADEINQLDETQSLSFKEAGKSYLNKRLLGQVDDIGSQYAYKKNATQTSRKEIISKFDWDETKPIVGVYASHWFDTPHIYGMSSFRDFHDWLEVVIEAAHKNDSVNWLFKNHPCEDYYGGITLHSLMEGKTAPHMRLVERDWNNTTVINAIDYVVTFHGTIGIEAASLGKPVLVADRGWYHDSGIAVWPKTRNKFIQALACAWWKDVDIKDIQRRAYIFAGWSYNNPDWQGACILPDESLQDTIYEKLPDFLILHQDALIKEMQVLRDWHKDAHHHYHIYKMKNA